MRTSRVWTLALACGAALACGGQTAAPRAQWVIRVRTDAPVPQLGDRLAVALLDDHGTTACEGCSRLFGIGGQADLPLSFGIADPGGHPFRLRVRMFRADHSTAGGEPEGGLPIDVVGTLPDTRGGVRRVRVDMLLACAGVAADLTAGTTCGPDGQPRPIAELEDDDERPLATNALAEATPCPTLPPGMVCIPGSVFALGESRDVFDPDPLVRPAPERLVHVRSFAMDATELTVGEMRALVGAGKVEAPIVRGERAPACTYTDAPGELERHPVSCITRDLAERVCAVQGKRLPTEAEWEYAAGNGAEETTYPWGDDDDTCRWAVVGRGRIPGVEGGSDTSTRCRTELATGGTRIPWGPVAVDDGNDVTALGLRHLGGNVAEWVADGAHGYDTCFPPSVILEDPRCTTAPPGVSPKSSFMVRGGSWQDLGLSARATARTPSSAEASPFVGVRCVYP